MTALRSTHFRGMVPKFWDVVSEITAISDHAAKFRADQPMELGDCLLKKRNKKTNKK